VGAYISLVLEINTKGGCPVSILPSMTSWSSYPGMSISTSFVQEQMMQGNNTDIKKIVFMFKIQNSMLRWV
jgi:hypothetical protein